MSDVYRSLTGQMSEAEETSNMGIESTLAERKGRYGDFKDHAAMAQELLAVASSDRHQRQVFWTDLTPVKKHAITYILDKVARLMTGDPEYKDSWHDIAGYAKLAEDRCRNTDPDQYSISIDDNATYAVAEAAIKHGYCKQHKIRHTTERGCPVCRHSP